MEIFSPNQKWLELNGKKKSQMKPENLKSDFTSSDPNQLTRSALREDETKLTWSKVNGKSSSGAFPFANALDNPSTDDWTSSTDCSPSSRSYTVSSTSGSVDNVNSSQQIPLRNLEPKGIKPELPNGESPCTVNTGDKAYYPNTSCANIGRTSIADQDEIDKSNSLVSDCANISDYVENALHISNRLTPDQSKTKRNGESHGQPSFRINSFQSSSTLNSDTKRPLDITDAESSIADLKPDIVTLDFVKSAARTFNSTSNDNDDAGSFSSLTSSFMSSVDSHDGSSIDSDVVENLYSKIAAATAKHKLKLTKSEPIEDNYQQKQTSNGDLSDSPATKCINCNGVLIQTNLKINQNDPTDVRCCGNNEPYDVIEELDFSNSNLKEVPEEIYQHAATLTSLSLESNAITDLPKELFDCQNLHELYVADNDIAMLPANLAGLAKLKHLDISKNVIEDIPECMPCLKNMVVLDASVNPIEKLSESFTQLMNLQELYMNDCFFDYLPASFGRMSELRVLELRDNQLQILPKSIRRLLNLTRLDLGGNVLQDWPDVISKLTSLNELWLDCNELNKVSNEIGELTQLVYLDLSRNFLESLPSQISSLLELNDLLLAENNLSSLPDNIGFLRRLTVINLEHNQLEKLPESFGKLESLEEVDISHNKLVSLPSSIGKLKKLRMLLLDNNKLQAIPEEMGQCIMLSIVQLSRNQIESLPDGLGNLKNLRVLNISQNRIPFLPITLRNLTQLEALWISPNQSKPSVPVHVEVDPATGRQILINVLFPQEESGISRVSKVLGSINSRDSQDYAVDAADDDDLEEYSKKERGTTQVFFDLDATTYSDVWENSLNEKSFAEDSTNQPLKDRLNLNNDGNVATARTNVISPEAEEKPRIQRQVAVNDYAIVIPKQHQPTGLSVSFEEHQPIQVLETKFSDQPVSDTMHNGAPKLSFEGAKENGCLERSESQISSQLEVFNISDHQSSEKNAKPIDHVISQTVNDQVCEKLNFEDNEISHVDENINISSTKNLELKIPQKPSNLLAKECHAPADSSVAKLPIADDGLIAAHSNASNSARFTEKAVKPELTVVNPPPMENDVFKKDHEPIDEKETLNGDSKAKSFEKAEDQKLNLRALQFIDSDGVIAPMDDKSNLVAAPYSLEDKPSSVTSGESIPATDDSGVGFIDAENHEDNEMDVATAPGSAPKISWKSLTPSHSYEPRFNDSKISKSPQPAPEDLVKNQPFPLNSGFDPSNVTETDSKCVKPAENEDNKSSQRPFRPRKPPVLPPPVAKKNKVSLNIKKFEKQAQKVPLSTNGSLGFSHTTQVPKQQQVFASPKRSDSIPTSKPMAVATILSQDRSQSKTEVRSNDDVIKPYSPPSDKNGNDVLKSLDLYTKTSLIEKQNFSSPTSTPRQKQTDEDSKLKLQQESVTPQSKPVHVRKSKFDEALAATKHKHFREKLEKAMQQQQHQTSLTNSIKRLSRGSTSSIASIPRITSPVPHSFSFDSMTADQSADTKSPQTTSTISLHLKLKERLHSSVNQTANAKLDLPTVVNKSRRKEHRNPSTHRASQSQKVSQSAPKLSLEEQLGQLCLDGSTNSPPHSKQGFVPYLPDEYCQSTSTRNIKKTSSKEKSTVPTSENQRRPSRPEDWRHQLLEYLERKKSTNEIPSEKSASLGNFSRRDVSFHNQNTPEQEPTRQFSKNVDRSVAKTNEISHATYVSSSNHLQTSKFGFEPTSTMSSGSISYSSALPHSKQPGRRAPGKYQRTRTPGPEMNASNSKVDLAIRPKSAMDRPIPSSDPFDPHSEIPRPPKPDYMKNKHSYSAVAPAPAPPSYKDHVLRHVGTSGPIKDDHQNYVNLDYFHNRLRASMREKRHDNPTSHQAAIGRMSHSNLKGDASSRKSQMSGNEQLLAQQSRQGRPLDDSRWNSATTSEHPCGSEKLTSQQFHEKHPPRTYQPFQAEKQHYSNPLFLPNADPSREAHVNQQYYSNNIPAEDRTQKSGSYQLAKDAFSKQNMPTERTYRDSHPIYDDPYVVHERRRDNSQGIHKHHQPSTNQNYASYLGQSYTVHPTMQQTFMENEESVVSAFRPYQEQQLMRPGPNMSYKSHPNMPYPAQYEAMKPTYDQQVNYDQLHYQHPMDLLDGYQHQNAPFMHRNDDFAYSQRQNMHHSRMKSFPGQFVAGHSGETIHPLPEDSGMGVEVFAVTVKKNPNFGFHIMGGVDSGGNPYRPDDDGVFITYVASGGAADGLLQPGDKILMVNGSEFIGINHKRAVDLLRNAGLAAKLVVERLVGRPV